MLRILRSRCCGSGSCVELAPDVFEIDERGRAVIIDSDAASPEVLLEAVEGCPSDAIEFEFEVEESTTKSE